MNAGTAVILFNAGFAPAVGQTVEVQYWFNSWPNLIQIPVGPGSGKEVHGTFSSPIAIDPTVGIVPSSALDQTWYVIPTIAGAQTISASPAIAPGTVLGQTLRLKGVDSANYLKISSASGSGTNQNGICSLTDNQSITYEWDGSEWNENTRRS